MSARTTRRFSTTSLTLLTVAACALGCGHSAKKVPSTDGGRDARADDATTDAIMDAKPDAAGDAPSEAPASTDSSTDASGEASSDTSLEAVEAPPPFDAGASCVPPTGETALSATAEGLPSDGLVLWLRGDHGVYKTATSDVCAWANQTGNHEILTGTGSPPAWEATGLGAQPAIHFKAAGQQLGTGSLLGLAPTSARTIIAVSELIATTQRFQAVFQGESNTPGTYLGLDENTFDTAGNREGVYAMNNAYDATLATSATPRVHVYTLSTMTVGTPILGNIDYRVNGATQTLTRTPGGFGNGNFEDFSGANFTSVGSGAEGIIAEVLVYSRALTVTERAAVETALEARYGIQ